MKIFLVALSAFIGTADEPNEYQMRTAFSEALTVQIQNALEFVDETDGPEAVARLREAGNDRFSVNGFQKLNCLPDEHGYICDFVVDIDLVNGPLRRSLTGRFINGPDGLVFFHEV